MTKVGLGGRTEAGVVWTEEMRCVRAGEGSAAEGRIAQVEMSFPQKC